MKREGQSKILLSLTSSSKGLLSEPREEGLLLGRPGFGLASSLWGKKIQEEAFSMSSLSYSADSQHVHEFTLRIYFEDTDFAGIVYHANYLKFMERGRTEWIRELGFEQSFLAQTHNIVFVVATLKLEFKRPARIDEKLVVKTFLNKIGNASIVLNQVLENEDSEINCEGFVRLGCINLKSLRATRIPEEIRGKFYYVD